MADTKMSDLTSRSSLADGDLMHVVASSTNYQTTLAYLWAYIKGKVQALSAKTTPVDADILTIQDSEDSSELKELTLTNLWAWVVGKVQGLSAKTAPVAADILTIQDSEDSNALKELTLANLKTVTGAQDVASYGSNQTLSAAECGGYVIYVTGAATITLPAIAAGMSVTIITIGAVEVSVDPNASDKIVLDGTALDDGDKITNASTAGDIAVLTYYSADGWYASTNGWTDGGA
jgi:hypothetical protein